MGNTPGWTPDPSTLAPVQSGWNPDPSTLSQTAPTEQNPVAGLLSGIGAGVFRTVQGAENLVNKALPNSMQLPAMNPALTSENTAAEKVGGGLESIGEFITGDEALKGLDLAGRLGLATQVAKIAQQSPRIARAIEIGMNALRMGTVGGAQGGVGAASEGKPVAFGTEAGAAGGALGSAVGEGLIAPGIAKVGEALENVAPKFGNALLQANKVKNFQYGKNPGRVFLDEDISANPPWQDYADVEKSIKKAGDKIATEAQGVLSQSPNANVKIPVVPQVNKIIDDALDDVSKRQGLPDRKGLITDLEDLRKEFTHNFDAKGNSTGAKGPLTAAEITKLKSNIGRGTKWDPNKAPETTKFLNNVRKQVYSYLDGEVDKAVPEMADINARWANQIEAEHLIGPRVAQEQAAAYGHSKAVSRAVLGAGAGLILSGSPEHMIEGGGLILNEAARTPAARIAITKGASAAGKTLGKKAVGEAAKKVIPAVTAKAAEEANQ